MEQVSFNFYPNMGGGIWPLYPRSDSPICRGAGAIPSQRRDVAVEWISLWSLQLEQDKFLPFVPTCSILALLYFFQVTSTLKTINKMTFLWTSFINCWTS